MELWPILGGSVVSILSDPIVFVVRSSDTQTIVCRQLKRSDSQYPLRSPSFSACLKDKWHRYTHGNKSAPKYVEKFDEFLVRCNTLSTEGKSQVLFRFRAGLRDDLRTELLARKITKFEKAYALVQDLDVTKFCSISKRHTQTIKHNSSSYLNHFQSQTSTHKENTKGKSVENKGKDTDNEFSKLTPTIKCYKCQGYDHVVTNCSSLVKITLVNGVPEVVSDSDSVEFIFQREDEDSDIEDETTGDDMVLTTLSQQ